MRPSQGRYAGSIPATRLINLPPPKALKGHSGGPAAMPTALGGQGRYAGSIPATRSNALQLARKLS